jgi:hypothetical protein
LPQQSRAIRLEFQNKALIQMCSEISSLLMMSS